MTERFANTLLFRRTVRSLLSIALVFSLLLQAMPSLLDIATFLNQREELTSRYCVNIEAPQLDCRAACYLETKIAAHAEKLSSSQNSQVPSTSALPSQVQYLALDQDFPKLAACFSESWSHTPVLSEQVRFWTSAPIATEDRPPAA